jgi:hypothetical protein
MLYKKQLLLFKSVTETLKRMEICLVNMGVNAVNSRTYRIKHSAHQYITMLLLQKVNCQIILAANWFCHNGIIRLCDLLVQERSHINMDVNPSVTQIHFDMPQNQTNGIS